MNLFKLISPLFKHQDKKDWETLLIMGKPFAHDTVEAEGFHKGKGSGEACISLPAVVWECRFWIIPEFSRASTCASLSFPFAIVPDCPAIACHLEILKTGIH